MLRTLLALMLLSFGCLGSQNPLQARIDALSEGEVLTLSAAEYVGPLVIDKAIAIVGEPGTIIDAGGKGSAVTIKAAGVRLQGLEIRNWGGDLYEHDSGVRLLPGADDVRLLQLELSGPGFGIHGEQLKRPEVEYCHISGDDRRYLLDRGDGIFLKYVEAPELHYNQIASVRDGIYLENVDASRVSHNQFSRQQYGIHYMYTRNDSAWNNSAKWLQGGYALMSSKGITLEHNQVSAAIDFGILLNVTQQSEVHHNRVTAIHNPKGDPAIASEGKGLFIYGAADNRISHNHFSDSDTGISVALGGEGNSLWRNNIENNLTQVRYVGSKSQEWSLQGQGNYWSSYQGWDLDGDGIGDTPYLPNDALDRLFWLYPEARWLLDSPVVLLLRWLQRQLALAEDIGIRDSFPLLQPIDITPKQEMKTNSQQSDEETHYAQH
ncbi:nitrous oxide reductase family maturation protein NosD [Shewanella algae]|uniref:nitrous oxide reductase family maturation protein NosD n=1 Tax=Shewanella algae TaxID=38313 RepID=UPI001F192B98|nr:nitrous oxide reductase family maturation protein NosD [Shewanella algae]MCE9777660.1 nitrous oxide reductase family maturation protein NosD [Shewanella algae]MCE9826947.1 nitrous oxide reductase family maturation protein NosD [Shewanella algae]